MKKQFLAVFSLIIVAISCTKKNEDMIQPQTEVITNTTEITGCASNEVMQAAIKADPSILERMNKIEKFTDRVIKESEANSRLLSNGIIEIPIVFNVLYNLPSENLSDAQLQSQVDALNRDFAATNDEYRWAFNEWYSSKYVAYQFRNQKAGNTGIKFVLKAINKKYTTKAFWNVDTETNFMKSIDNGGINATSPTNTLNIWVCNLSGNTLGYAYYPGGVPSSIDGIVLDPQATGTIASSALDSRYNMGRTAVHEVGHWLNLRHIWGDSNCGSDLVDDTPVHNEANFGTRNYYYYHGDYLKRLNHYSTCSGKPLEMTMNYMDYTNDAYKFMFSAGQRNRMKATFAAGGPRNSFAQP